MKYHIYSNLKRVARVSLVCILLLSTASLFAQFTGGNVVVLQAGNGTETLSANGNSMFLKEYSTTGTLTYTKAITNSGATALITSGNATSEGGISLSSDGSAIVVPGYNTPVGGATGLSGSSSASIPRGIGLVSYDGTYTLESTSNTAFNANNIRGAASNGTSNYWASGANTGIAYFGDGTPVTVTTTTTNNRSLSIQNGQLYYSTGSGSNRGVYKVGNGTPVTSGTTSTVFVNAGGSASPYQFAFNSNTTVCYIADDRAVASGGGIQKWVFSAGTWSLSYTLGTGAGSTVGARGLIVDFSGANPVIYATTAEASLNRLIKITDTGAGSSASTLATATANTIFRGLSFAPQCTPVDVVSVASNSPVCSNENLELSATVTGTAPFTYLWSGTGTFSPDNTASAPVVSGAAAGNYSVTVTNACGNDNGLVSVTIDNPTTWYADLDGDGWGDEFNTLSACDQPLNYISTFGDCNDNSNTSFPGASEILCDNVDNNCDGNTDEGSVDGCNDPDATNFDPAATCNDGSCNYIACDGVQGGLQDIFVETYYVSDANDASDTNGGSLTEGSVTYRVYVDMAPGYELQAVYGNGNHALNIASTADWFNNVDRGETTGAAIPDNRLDENTVALDSWIAMGGASTLRTGVLKTDDADGSLVGGANNDGGSAGIAGGLLVNNDPLAGIELTTADGLISGAGPAVTIVGLDVSMFDNLNSATALLSNGGAWSVLEGVQGPDGSNRVLIGQFTTAGEFSFTLNVQLGTPDGGVEQYVWSNPIG
ncbi:MAG: putative metal-binding motif-containing protein, partial [Flavobacteriales bacterium]|nr:putative metal-binding motif-containing protein [Flavobacteriales bacterium]